MTQNGFRSDERPVVKYVQDVELAYIMQRYREIHDTLHVLLGYGVSVPEELAVKWYEMSVLGLPSSALASFFGPLNVLGSSIKNRDSSDLVQMTGVFLPHVLECLKH